MFVWLFDWLKCALFILFLSVCVLKFKKCYSFFPELTNWKNANTECWRRYMTLASLNSLEELQFVKYKLREKRYFEMPSKIRDISEQMNVSFYAHIGKAFFKFNFIILVHDHLIMYLHWYNVCTSCKTWNMHSFVAFVLHSGTSS